MRARSMFALLCVLISAASLLLGCASGRAFIDQYYGEESELSPEELEPPEPSPPPPPPTAIALPESREPAFGTVSTDSEGRRRLTANDSIANEENQNLGWVVWVGESDQPVRLVETQSAIPLRSSDANHPAAGQVSSSSVEVLPVNGFVQRTWWVGPDELPGTYDLTVELPSGERKDFSYELGLPLGSCPFRNVLLDFWWAQLSEEGDPHERDLSYEVIREFSYQLAEHGFFSSSLSDAYWKVRVKAARAISDREMAYGHIEMQAMGDAQGNAIRYASYTVNYDGIVDYSVLFETPAPDLDDHIRDQADQFAAAMTPHVEIMCDQWRSRRLAEVDAVEDVRKALVEEMTRVRENNAIGAKSVEISIDEDNPS